MRSTSLAALHNGPFNAHLNYLRDRALKQ